jgi:hypothetical protein
MKGVAMAEKQGTKGGRLEGICSDLERALDPSSIETTNVVELVDTLMQKIHELPVGEKEKLKKKDAAFKKGLATLSASIQGADYMPQGTAKILLTMVGAMMAIEDILEELKALHGVK